LDTIVKAVVERGTERWRLRLFLGKQPVEFRMTEAMKRREREYTAEERTAKDFWLREKHDWHGSGILRFKIEPGEDLREETWEETKSSSLEDKIPEIVDALANVEETAKRIRAERAAQRKAEAERHDLEMEKWRRQLRNRDECAPAFCCEFPV
jgi:hypothetical protein